MPNALNPHKAGLALGGLLGLWHLVWALMVAVGLAQPFIDWILRLHMIKPFYVILPFSVGSALMLIIITAVSGYIMGWVFAKLWNSFQKK